MKNAVRDNLDNAPATRKSLMLTSAECVVPIELVYRYNSIFWWLLYARFTKFRLDYGLTEAHTSENVRSDHCFIQFKYGSMKYSSIKHSYTHHMEEHTGRKVINR